MSNLSRFSKQTLVMLLLEDFIRTCPDSDRATRVLCHSQLMGLDSADLELLVSQLPEEALKQLPQSLSKGGEND